MSGGTAGGVFTVDLLLDSTNETGNRCAAHDEMIAGTDEAGAEMRQNNGHTAAVTQRSAMCSVTPRSRVFLASALAAVGGVLFGYDTGTLMS